MGPMFTSYDDMTHNTSLASRRSSGAELSIARFRRAAFCMTGVAENGEVFTLRYTLYCGGRKGWSYGV